MPLVYSTMTNNSEYVEYKTNTTNNLAIPVRKVVIKGGAGVSQKRTLITPLGVRTEVSAEDLAFLQNDVNFKRHVDAGFLKVVSKGKPDADAVAADMQQRDGSAPLVPNDYVDGSQPKVGDEKPVSEVTTAPRSKPLSAFK